MSANTISKTYAAPSISINLSSQVCPSDFPPLKSLDISPNNLPVQLTSFIGRAREMGEVKQQLSGGRLVTLTGPGGSGKTRLALQVAAEVAERFQAGVFFVALAPITDPRLVASTIADTLGLTEASRPVDPGPPQGLFAAQSAAAGVGQL